MMMNLVEEVVPAELKATRQSLGASHHPPLTGMLRETSMKARNAAGICRRIG